MQLKISRYLFLTTFFVLLAQCCIINTESNVEATIESPQVQQSILAKYARSIAIGASVGATTGVADAFLEKHLECGIIIAWIVEYSIRTHIINMITQDLRKQNIEYEQHLIEIIACVISWVAYIKYGQYVK